MTDGYWHAVLARAKVILVGMMVAAEAVREGMMVTIAEVVSVKIIVARIGVTAVVAAKDVK